MWKEEQVLHVESKLDGLTESELFQIEEEIKTLRADLELLERKLSQARKMSALGMKLVVTSPEASH